MAEIAIRSISKTYPKGKRPAVNSIDLTIADGEFMVLLGPSGCGKTTLLRLIAGLEYPDSGSVSIGGRDVTNTPPRKREIAMVFQSYAIFPHMTVRKNIAFGLSMRHVSQDEIRRRVDDAAKLVQLEDFLERYPAQLSGGQRQRVAVARAIVMQPDVLLMDEPLSNLDALLRLQFRAELKKLVQELRTTTIYVTHDQVEALSLGTRIAVMREGEIVQVDAPMQVYDTPRTTFVGGFIGNPPMNFLRGQVQGSNGRVSVALGSQMLDAPTALSRLTGQEVQIGIRAENIDVWPHAMDGALPAEVQVVEPLGADVLLTVEVAGQSLKLLTRNDFPASPGLQISLRPQENKLRWFDQSGMEAASA
ncbi:MAG TPA: ABC transporter ATP-binding protein [Chloroflexota bacterium]